MAVVFLLKENKDMNKEELMQVGSEKNHFANYLGIRITEIKEGYAKGEMEIEDKFQNIINSVHGGCLFSLADTIAGAAAISYGEMATTISGSMNYLSPAMDTKKIMATAIEIKHGKRISVYDVEVVNDIGKLLAKGSFSFFNLEKTAAL